MLKREAVIEELKKSNRLFDVKCLIYDIIESVERVDAGDLPVRVCISDDGKLITHVKSKDVYSEVRQLFEVLSTLPAADDSEEDGVNSCIHEDDYSNLSLYVGDHSDILLHNYAVSVSHIMGGLMDDEIRVWCILSNLLDNLYSDTWNVPVGWCKKEVEHDK